MKNADWSVRFSGGNNAGHTVWDNGIEYKLHQLPAGAVLKKKIALDAGMVINVSSLLEECEVMNIDPASIFVSEAAHVITDAHLAADNKGSGIGSTKKGIAYAYADKALRTGKRIGNLDKIPFRIYRGLPPIQPGENAVFEGAQGIMIDVDYGHYPYVTSSSVLPHAGHRIDKIIGVMKAYTTRVGDGPPNYPELPWLSQAGKEFGVTTGRLRKSYWLILEEIDYAISVCNPDEIVLTKLDVLEEHPISCWHNKKELKFKNTEEFKDFLVNRYPQIKRYSDSPRGPLKTI